MALDPGGLLPTAGSCWVPGSVRHSHRIQPLVPNRRWTWEWMLPPEQFQASQWESGAGEPAPEHLQDVAGVLAPIPYPHFLSVLLCYNQLLSAAVPAVSSLGL